MWRHKFTSYTVIMMNLVLEGCFFFLLWTNVNVMMPSEKCFHTYFEYFFSQMEEYETQREALTL